MFPSQQLLGPEEKFPGVPRSRGGFVFLTVLEVRHLSPDVVVAEVLVAMNTNLKQGGVKTTSPSADSPYIMALIISGKLLLSNIFNIKYTRAEKRR